jgi:hypothetical protein
MQKRRRADRKTENTLDRFSMKRSRGRPPKIQTSWVMGRAQNSRTQLAQVWPNLCDSLLKAKTEEQVISAFEDQAQPYSGDFVPRLAKDVLTLVCSPKFPKKSKAQIGFLADSLAGRPSVTFRRSRDICARERAKQEAISPHKIIRKEFYIECECGYKGPARDNACRKCGAQIPQSLEILWGYPNLS